MTKRIFVASVATETNTFSPLPVDLQSFREGLLAMPGEHPEYATLCSGVFPVCRSKIPELGWELIEGLSAWAEPGGLIRADTWEYLKNQVLEQVRECGPLDAVILGLHGAMVAQNCQDCEGELLQAVRQITGEKTIIGATFDPHSHLTPKRLEYLDVFAAFKEFPHTDFRETAENLVAMVIDGVLDKITPHIATFDCRMIEVLPTNRHPMKGIVAKARTLEKRAEVLSVSLIHGFMAGDVPHMGTQVAVITDGAPGVGQLLAGELGEALFQIRGRSRPPFLTPPQAIQYLDRIQGGPITVADVWDNPGGGVAGDATILARAFIEAGITDVALGAMWDPMAVRIAQAAGPGARIHMRIGGKTDPRGGAPLDLEVHIDDVFEDGWQTFGEYRVSLGPTAVVTGPNNFTIVLTSKRAQTYAPDLFANQGIEPLSRKVLLIKSTNHFFEAFQKISPHLVYVDAGAPYPANPKTNAYQHLVRPIWPIVSNPFKV